MKTTRTENGTYKTVVNGVTYEIEQNYETREWNIHRVINDWGFEEWEWCQTFDTKKECLIWLSENK